MTVFTIYSSENQFRKTVVERLGDGNGSLATTATTGFLYVPTCAGVPTGIPVPQDGMMPVVGNSLTGVLYRFHGGAWAAV